MNVNPGKQAVILSGGAANGAYEIGVMKALMTGAAPTTNGIPLDPAVLTGTSIGAYTASVIVSQLEVVDLAGVVAYLEHLWLDVLPRDDATGHNHAYRFRGDPKNCLNPNFLARNPIGAALQFASDLSYVAGDSARRSLHFLKADGGSLLGRAFESIDLSTVITREPFERLLAKTVNFENIDRSHRVVIIAASNWRTGETRLFSNRKSGRDSIQIAEILASSAIPGFFPYVVIDGEPYVDGGLTLNTPLEPAIHDEQADTAHIVYVDPYFAAIPIADLPTTLNTMDRFISFLFANSVHADVKTARRINEGLKIVYRAERGERILQEDAVPFVIAARKIADSVEGQSLPVSLKTIHQYRPKKDLGGALELLDFSRERIQRLIDLGYRDTVEHNCHENECVV